VLRIRIGWKKIEAGSVMEKNLARIQDPGWEKIEPGSRMNNPNIIFENLSIVPVFWGKNA
jgi:hypothetical protein